MNRKTTRWFGDLEAAYWTQEQIDKAIALDNIGLSAREIGEVVGKTKNAVIRKLHKHRGNKYRKQTVAIAL
jgi:hypothetical protein